MFNFSRFGLLAAIAPYVAFKLIHFFIVNTTTTGFQSMVALGWFTVFAIMAYQTVTLIAATLGGANNTLNIEQTIFRYFTFLVIAVQGLFDLMGAVSTTGIESIYHIAYIVGGILILFFNVLSTLVLQRMLEKRQA